MSESQEVTLTISQQQQPRCESRQETYWSMCKNIPIFNVACIAVYVAMFVWYHDLSRLELDTDEPREAWRLYTYSLLHANLAHILNNCIFMVLMGMLLNIAHGNIRVFLIHTAGVLGGAYGVEWEKTLFKIDRLRVIGASGSIYCIAGAQVGNLIINWGEMPFRYARLFILTYLFVADILAYVFFYQENVSYSCHLGGFLAGVFLSPFVLVNVRKLKWEKPFRWTCLTLFTAGMLASTGMYMHHAITDN